MAKCLILFPPQWSPFSPHLAPVAISSMIKDLSHHCDIKDFNIEFYNEILTKDFLKKTLVKNFNELIVINKELKQSLDENKSADDYSLDFQIKAKKLLKLNNIRDNKLEETKRVIELIEAAVSILKNKEQFYNPDLIVNALAIVERALNLVSLNEFPQELTLYNLKNNVILFNYESILSYCSYSNIFFEFYKKSIDEIVSKKYDLIGISISSSTQLLSALTLSKMLKEKSKKTKILLGGNYISRITDAICDTPEFFNQFCDFVIYEEGERAIKELIESISRKRSLKDVSSLIYKDTKGNVQKNEKKCPIALSKLPEIDIKDYDLKKYFLPEIIMPIQASRGCYWKKCTFCDHFFGQTYNIKDIDKLIHELKNLQDKYSINNFEFTDEAMTPDFLDKFSDKLLESGLKINWYCDLRLEDISFETFKKAYLAGLKMVLWGFEAGSKRVMDMINKGIDFEKRFEILKRASDAGIFNFAYVFTGFPTETYEEAMETINAVCNNTDIIHAFGKSVFTMGKHSIINLNPEKFFIEKLQDVENFSSDAKYIIKQGLKAQELDKINDIFVDRAYESYGTPLWMYLNYREILFLYIVKYGSKELAAMKYKS